MYLHFNSFENTGGKGEIARNKPSPFPTVFSTVVENFLPFLSNLKLSSANPFSLEESKICRLEKGFLSKCKIQYVYIFARWSKFWACHYQTN